MIYAFTGIPGAGKTLNALKFVRDDERFSNRKVYVYNVNELNYSQWEVINTEQATKWYELPDDSVILLDEVQEIWRPKNLKNSELPPTLEHLEKHRHRGIDLSLIHI